MAKQFSDLDYLILTTLDQLQQKVTIDDVSTRIGVDQAKVSAACLWFADEGIIDLNEEQIERVFRDFRAKEKATWHLRQMPPSLMKKKG